MKRFIGGVCVVATCALLATAQALPGVALAIIAGVLVVVLVGLAWGNRELDREAGIR